MAQITRFYEPQIRRFFGRNRFLAPDDVDDLTQQSLLCLVDSVSRFKRRCGFGGWVFSIARNIAITHARHRARDGRRRHLFAMHRGLDGVVHWERDLVDCKRALAKTRDLLEALPSHYRDAVVLHLRGADHFEAAAAVGCEYNTARSRRARGRKLLADRVRAALGEDRLAAALGGSELG